MTSALRRGLIAGAAGTTALGVVSYLDMALRGRPASTTSARSVDVLAQRLGVQVPGSGQELDNRREALGAVLGTVSGLAVGALAGKARAGGVRLSRPLGALATGAAAMAASDVPLAALGISDPRTWTASDWLADALPHLAYGATTHSVLVALEGPAAVRPRATARVVGRAAVLGLAAGGRSSLGLAGPALASSPSSAKARAAVLALAGELVADKLPATPNRTSGGSLTTRVAAGAGGGAALAKAHGVAPALPMAAGALGSLAGSYGGLAWRTWSARTMPPVLGAVLEDAVAITLAMTASRGGDRALR